MPCWEGFGNLADGRPFWVADFDGDGRDELLFYSPSDDNWWIADMQPNGRFVWSLAGNTAGFGHGINDGRPFWVGDFNGDTKAEILFYYPGDDNWWLGTFTPNANPLLGATLGWTLVGNTRGFGHGIWDGRPFWTGRFVRPDRDSMLFYYPGDDNWWVGTMSGGQLTWGFAGNTAGFGHAINDGRPFWTGRFVQPDRSSVLFYYPGDDNWWIGTFSNAGQMSWSLAGNTAGFGHRINDGRPFWTGDFNGGGKTDVLFYYPGDDNWWLGSFSGTALTWSSAGNTAGFGHRINDGRPFWIGNFVSAGKDSVVFYYPGDDNWSAGTRGTSTLGWTFAGNTAGFGHAIYDGRPYWVGDFGGDGRDEMLFYYPGDGNWWRGTHSGPGGQFTWSFAGNTGAPFDASFNLNVILVGIESFGAAQMQQVRDSIQIMRDIYRKVGIVIASVQWWHITNAEAGANLIVDSNAEAADLTGDWAVANDGLDMFVVTSMTFADGISPKSGPCNKNSWGMTGSVVSLNGSTANSGNTFAHEAGHYFGLDHIPDAGNFIGGGGSSDSATGIFVWQGDIMKTHCFMHNCD